MSEWKECKIADAPFEIIDGDRGTNYPKQDEFNQNGYCLFLNAKNVTTDGFAFDECYFISKEKDEILRKGKLRRNDIVLTTRGTVGNIGFFNERIPYEHIRINSGMVIIRPDPEDILPEYTHQLFKYLKGDFDVFATGSAQPQLPIRDLKEISFSLPPLPEQRAIASVLSSLDDKIDLLHRQNKTLEGMAEALWRKMFVEEADPGWKKGKLGDVVKIVYGKNLPTSELTESGYPVFGANGQIGYYKEYLYASPQVLISCRGEASGKVNFSCASAFVTNNSLVLEIPITSVLNYEFLKYWAFASDFTLYVTGSAQPQITIEELRMAEIDIPSEEKISHFSAVVATYENKRIHNYEQIANLVKLRDTLLPKLMSGEVRVRYESN